MPNNRNEDFEDWWYDWGDNHYDNANEITNRGRREYLERCFNAAWPWESEDYPFG